MRRVSTAAAGESSAAADDDAGPVKLLELAGQRVKHLVDLGAAEARLAALSGLAMLLLVVLSAASLVIAWGLAIATLLYALSVYADVPWAAAALVMAFVHAALAAVCWHYTTKLSRNLTLPVLRQSIGTAEDRKENAHESRAMVGR
jgi:hypothetical protein